MAGKIDAIILATMGIQQRRFTDIRILRVLGANGHSEIWINSTLVSPLGPLTNSWKKKKNSRDFGD